MTPRLRWRAQGEANLYALITEGDDWFAVVRMNGEMTVPKQEMALGMMAAAPNILNAIQVAVKCLSVPDATEQQRHDALQAISEALEYVTTGAKL